MAYVFYGIQYNWSDAKRESSEIIWCDWQYYYYMVHMCDEFCKDLQHTTH